MENPNNKIDQKLKCKYKNWTQVIFCVGSEVATQIAEKVSLKLYSYNFHDII